ncbi:hypothetical protein Tco_1387493, partial [Tanacetum coccineum]
MQTYWASIYLIPKTVVKELDKIIKNFLWDKVSWKIVCRPKDQGGLGIKPLNEWNEVLLMKNIWKIVVQAQTLWVQWVNRVKLKRRSVWDIDIDTNDSWGWKKLMELRSKMKPHVFHKIRNGETTSVCDNDCVANLIEDGRWKWPTQWFVKFPLLKSIEVPSINDIYDHTVWLNNKGKLKEFAIKDVWLDLRCQYSKVDWLQTQEIMAKWMNGQSLKCSLCNLTSDSIYHLFFDCCYSKKVWETTKRKIMLENVNWEWDNIIGKMQTMHCKNNLKSILSKIGVAACVYNIWREMNIRFFQDKKRNEDVTIREIIEDIKWKCSLCNLTSDSIYHLFFDCCYSKKVWETTKRKIMLENVNWEWDNIIGKTSNGSCQVLLSREPKLFLKSMRIGISSLLTRSDRTAFLRSVWILVY